MVNTKGYISLHFSKSFLMIFLPFFIIISLVFLVKIAALTSQIQISLSELLSLYSYSVPEIIFYTLPLSFISALANVLIKLSQSNELIALYALGLQSKKILYRLLFIGLLFSLLLTSLSLLAMPLSKQFYKAFKYEKKNEAQLNILPGKLGQKFGDFYIYVKKKEGEVFHDLVIYNRSNQANEQFFSSKTGKLNQKDLVTSLILKDGYGYTYEKEKLREAQYQTMEVFENAKTQTFKQEDLSSYWANLGEDAKQMKKMLYLLFISFIPLLSIYPIAAFTMINPRYQKNHSFIVIFVTAMTLYLIASILQKWGTVPMLLSTTLAIGILGRWIFQKRVAKYF